ncbi:unnamed protein product [Aphanomyces euteiches]
MAANARAIQAKMQREDGIENAVQSFYRHLPNMHCVFTPEHIATKWLKKDGMSKGAGLFFHELSGGLSSMVVEPVRGYKKDGWKGAGVGTLKGMSDMVVRPLNGVAKFVHRVAVGTINQNVSDHSKEIQQVDEPSHWTDSNHVKTIAGMVDVSLSLEERNAVQAALDAARANPPLSILHTGTSEPNSPSLTTFDEDETDSPTLLQTTSHGTFTIPSPDKDQREKQRTAFARSYSTSENAVAEDCWRDTTLPFSMAIAMLVVGLPSDVESFVAVGKAHANDGHRVRVAAARQFEALVTSNGLEYAPLDGNPTTAQDRLATLSHWQSLFPPKKTSDTPWNNDDAFAASTWRAVKSQDFRADMIVSHPDVMLHVHLAERLGVPLHLLSGTPYSPTADMPHPLVEVIAHDDKHTNWFSYLQVHSFAWNHFRHATNKFRTQQLNLEPWNVKHPPTWWQWHIPISYYWSSLLLSKRDEWGDEVDVVGFVQLDDNQLQFVPPPPLAAFVAQRGLRRVYVSLPGINSNELLSIAQALVKSRRDIQVIIGQEDAVDGSMVLSNRVALVDGSVSIKWLVDNIHVVVHQARDAKLLAEILQHNKPSVAVPVTATEKHYANHLHEMDPQVHLPPVLPKSLKGHPQVFADLVTKLVAAVDADPPSFWKHHVILETQDAVRRTVASIYKHLPVEAMYCDVLPSKLARVYDPELKLKLCYEAAYVANHLEADRVVKYTLVVYTLERLPQVAVKLEREPKQESVLDSLLLMPRSPARRPTLASEMSVQRLPVDTATYWTSQADNDAFRQRVLDSYDKFQASR